MAKTDYSEFPLHHKAQTVTSRDINSRHGGRRVKLDASVMAAARVMYESMPGSTMRGIARELNIAEKNLRIWVEEARLEGKPWMRAPAAMHDLTGRAAALADTFKTKMSELGKPIDPDTAAAEVAAEMSRDNSVGIRARVLDRHRKEWAAPRKLAYDAVQDVASGKADVTVAFERAKLAKILSETLTLIQSGECRAYGIKPDEKGKEDTIVVIERGEASDD